jgi:ribosomal protein L11
VLLRQRAGVDKGSSEANDIDAAMKIVEGTARSMGITVD